MLRHRSAYHSGLTLLFVLISLLCELLLLCRFFPFLNMFSSLAEGRHSRQERQASSSHPKERGSVQIPHGRRREAAGQGLRRQREQPLRAPLKPPLPLLHRRRDRKRPRGGPGRPQPPERGAAALRAAPRSPESPAPRRSPLRPPRPHRGSGAAPAAHPLAHLRHRRVPPRPGGACALRRSPPSGSAAGRRDGSHGEAESGGPDPGGGERPAAHPAPVRAAGRGGAGLGSASGRRGDGAGRRGAVRSERSVVVGYHAPARSALRNGLGKEPPSPTRLSAVGVRGAGTHRNQQHRSRFPKSGFILFLQR